MTNVNYTYNENAPYPFKYATEKGFIYAGIDTSAETAAREFLAKAVNEIAREQLNWGKARFSVKEAIMTVYQYTGLLFDAEDVEADVQAKILWYHDEQDTIHELMRFNH